MSKKSLEISIDIDEFWGCLKQRILMKEMVRVVKEGPDRFLEIMGLAQPRMKTLSDFLTEADYIFYPIRLKAGEFLPLLWETLWEVITEELDKVGLEE